MNQRKKILFITGTRADYGKIKPIMQKMEKKQEEYEVFVYVSGMHLLQKYGRYSHNSGILVHYLNPFGKWYVYNLGIVKIVHQELQVLAEVPSRLTYSD